MAAVIGIELRSLWLQGVGENHNNNLPHIGLNCWSPNIDIVRDPRYLKLQYKLSYFHLFSCETYLLELFIDN